MRSTSPIGTFDETAFQCFVDGTAASSPLRIGVSPLGHVNAPLLGTYMETYEPVLPSVLLQGSYSPKRVPESVASLFAEETDMAVSLFVQVHGQVPLNPCQHFTCDSCLEISVVFHSFFFPNVSPWAQEDNLFKVIQCGLFEPSGNLMEVHQNPKDEKGSGLRFCQLAPRDCIIHGGAYSPSNCQIERLPDGDWYSFWVVAKDEASKTACISFHAVAANDPTEDNLRARVAQCQSLDDLVACHFSKEIDDAIECIRRS